MKSTALAAMAVACILHVQGAQAAESASAPQVEASEAAGADEVEVAPVKDEAERQKLANSVWDFCIFTGRPPSDFKYSVVKSVKVGKGTYGGVKDILPSLADRARRTGADAIMNYTGSQRFGFWPWRMVRPVVRGVGIKWTGDKKPDCAATGGMILKDILATDTAPAE